MKALNLFFIMGLAICLSFCNGTSAKRENNPASTNGFAVVELFTSEGCSSCPPADEAMIRLAKEFPQDVYFIGYHVDYWDYLGWKDEFDSPDYTQRQNKYAERFALESIYTPQVIVNGEKELVGSRESQLHTLIQEKLKQPNAVDIQVTAAKTDGESVRVSYKVSAADNNLVNIALVQLKASTNVKRGENNGHQLNHINIVRSLKTINSGKSPVTQVDLSIPAGLTAKDLKIIAFVQKEKDLKIVGATEAAIQ